jgi:hypothetical protein
VQSLVVKMAAHFPFAHQTVPNEIEAYGFLDPLLLAKQDSQPEGCEQLVTQEDLPDPLPRPAVLHGRLDLGTADPSPFLSNFPDSGALPALPNQCVHQALP